MGNGRLEATEVQIASKTPGRLAEVLVDEGDKVSKGQLLARMDTRTLEAQRNQAEAEVLRARENLNAAQANVQLRQSEQLLAQQELKRSQSLFKHGYVSARSSINSRRASAPATLRCRARAQVSAVSAQSARPRPRWRS
jgi:HlyD family secretion protein